MLDSTTLRRDQLAEERASRAAVRVFVPTFRRPELLERAIASLRRQTFADWVCEVHNDDPRDHLPGALIARLGDCRIELCQHADNLGPTETFNLFYRPTREPFYCILEDDNWWEPEFLETMLTALESHPEAVMAWCNQMIWEELPDGSWRNTRKFVTEAGLSTGAKLVPFGSPRQVVGAIHSHGAMIVRSQHSNNYETPRGWPLAAIEPLRERMIEHPLLFVPRPLAVFARTIATARSESLTEWAVAQTILAATFLKHCDYQDKDLLALLREARAQRPPGTAALITAALLEPKCRRLLKWSHPIDWLLLSRAYIRRPRVFWEVIRSRRLRAAWWDALDRHTAARFAEKRSQA